MANINLQIADIITELQPGHTVQVGDFYVTRTDDATEIYEVNGERLGFYEAWRKVTN